MGNDIAMSGGQNTAERLTRAAIRPPPRLYPKRVFLLALTLGVWSFLFTSQAMEYVETASAGRAGAGLLLLGASCAAGVAMCVLLGRLLRRAPSSLFAGAAVMISGASLCAITWSLFARLLILPFADWLLLEQGGAGLDGAAVLPPTFQAALVFLAWAGGWFAVTYADALRETTETADRWRQRLVELEDQLDVQTGTQAAIDHIWAPTRTGRVKLPVEQIVSLVAEREYVRIRTTDARDMLLRGSLSALKKKLDPARFVQIHRSTVVNVDHVLEVSGAGDGGADVKLVGDASCRVSRRLAPALRALLDKKTSAGHR